MVPPITPNASPQARLIYLRNGTIVTKGKVWSSHYSNMAWKYTSVPRSFRFSLRACFSGLLSTLAVSSLPHQLLRPFLSTVRCSISNSAQVILLGDAASRFFVPPFVPPSVPSDSIFSSVNAFPYQHFFPVESSSSTERKVE